MLVKVYRNLSGKYKKLGKRMYSVVHRGKVVLVVPSIMLNDATFVVNPSGRQKVRETGEKQVHAYVRGTWVPDKSGSFGIDSSGRLPVDITYNPIRDDNFVTRYSKHTVKSAWGVILNQYGVTACYVNCEPILDTK